MTPGLASAGNIAASQIIAQGEIDHYQEPDQAGSDENPRERFFVANVHEEKDDEDSNVNGMDASHDPIKDPKDLRFGRQFRFEVAPGPELFGDVFVVFEAFDGEESEAEENRGQKETEEPFDIVFLNGVNGEDHSQAASEEDGRVDGAVKDDGMMAGLSKRLRVSVAIGNVAHEHGAEEKDFGGEKSPHTECGR